MSSPDPLAVIGYFALVLFGIAVHLVDRVFSTNKEPAEAPSKTGRQRLLDFVEQPLFLAVLGIIGGIVGVLVYTPVSLLCVVCILLALHRSKAVADQPTKIRVFWYVTAFVVASIILLAVGFVVRASARNYVHDVANAVVDAITKNMVQQQPIKNESPTESQLQNKAFSISSESELSSFGDTGRFTGFWLRDSSDVITPITDVLYVRITNLLPVRTMIARFEASLGNCPASDKLDTLYSQAFLTMQLGLPGTPAVGRTLNVPNNNTGLYMVRLEIEKADLSRAALLDMPLLDRLLSNHYLAPNDTIGGWVLFNSTCVGDQATFQVEDVAGRSFSYQVMRSNKMRTGDLLQRTITITQLANLSRDKIAKHRAGNP